MIRLFEDIVFSPEKVAKTSDKVIEQILVLYAQIQNSLLKSNKEELKLILVDKLGD